MLVAAGDLQSGGNRAVEGLVQGNIVAYPDKEALLRVIGKGREKRRPTAVLRR